MIATITPIGDQLTPSRLALRPSSAAHCIIVAHPHSNSSETLCASPPHRPTAMARMDNSSTAFRCTFRSARGLAFLVVALSAGFQLANSFGISMEYRPPLKSSVSKLLSDRRNPSGAAANGQPSNTVSRGRGGGASPAQNAHAIAYGVPTSSSAPSPSSSSTSFERRMRQLVLGAPMRGPSVSDSASAAAAAPLPRNVHLVQSLADYKKLVGDETSKMVVVRFYASWCRACKAVAPLFHRMAAAHPDVVFVEVPVTPQTAAIHQGLGVPSLPFGHLYHPSSGLVEEMKLTRKHISAFELRLDCYLQGFCDLSSQEAWATLGPDSGAERSWSSAVLRLPESAVVASP